MSPMSLSPRRRDPALDSRLRGNERMTSDTSDQKTVDRPIGPAAGGSAAGRRARRVCRRHQFSASASYAHRALRACPWPHRRRSTPRRRARCPASSRCGPPPTSPRCRRSISARARIPALDPYRQPVLANDRVRYVGEPVAAVFAADPYVAEDAADLVAMDDRGIAAAARRASRAGRVLARPRTEAGDHPPGLWRRRRGVPRPPPTSSSSSLPSAGIPACRWRRAAPSAATTPRATFSNCTAPPRCRTAFRNCSRACSASPPSAIHVHESHVGGGFGVRGELYPEDVLVCVAAKRFNRPVKWIEDRREHLIAANHSRQQLHKIRAAVDADGVILAIDDVYFHDQGAYVRTHAARVVHMTARHPARALSGAGLSLDRPFPAHQQDAGRDLSRARPLRDHLRARAAGRCDRAAARHRPHRDAPAQCHRRRRKCPIRGRSKRWARKSSTTPAIISGCSTSCSPRSAGTSSTPR